MTSSIAIQIAYGLDVQSHDDSRLVLLQSVVDEAIKACQPGEFLVVRRFLSNLQQEKIQ